MKVSITAIREMIRDELSALLIEQPGDVTTYAGQFAAADTPATSVADRNITSAESQDDEKEGDEQDDEDPTDPSVQAQHKIDDETKQAQAAERSKAVGYPE